jgi:hypothetical protein
VFDVERIGALVKDAKGLFPGVGVELTAHGVGLLFSAPNRHQFEDKVRIEAVRQLPWHTAWSTPPRSYIDAEFEVLK